MTNPAITYGHHITPREQAIIRLYVLDHPKREIAVKLGISFHGAKSHISHVYTKLGLSSQLQLAAWALRNGLVTPTELKQIEPKGRYHA